ncbi:MAG TPA: helix-turn-helix domain-containing protein [Gemmatimonadaceae bacterium]|nr:helix-turn-helix domain-containing protein [Gemmatimonadaceae bacterium]
MQVPHTHPPGFRGTRGELLEALKREQPLTVRELASRFGLTPNGLRRHLKLLEDEGLVRYRREVRGVGGPVFAYTLTAEGEALFPRAYDTALEEALELLRESQGAAAVARVFGRQWARIAERVRPSLRTLPLAERARALAEALTAEGYMAEAASAPGSATIREHNCAIRDVAERHPEACDAEAAFLEDLLGAKVTRRAHILQGCNACEYAIQDASTIPEVSAPVEGAAGSNETKHTEEQA